MKEVYKGGGSLGCAYAGVAKALSELGMHKADEIAGTSAGAIFAALRAVGYDHEELKEITFDTDFTKFYDGKFKFIRLINRLGMYKGKYFESWIKDKIEQGCGNGNVTFKEMVDLTPLYITAMDWETGESVLYSAKTTPNLPIYKAVRASMSIPFLFEPMKIMGKLLVDGGFGWNYPIDLWKDNVAGFYLTTPDNCKNKNFKLSKIELPSKIRRFKRFKIYTSRMFEIMMELANNSHINSDSAKKTIFINTYDYSSTNFALTEREKTRLYESGYKSTMVYFS